MSPSNLASVLKYRQSENIIITSELEKWHLDGLFDRTIDAVRVPGYFSQQAAHDIANKIKRSAFFGNYVNAPKIGRIGQAFFECQNDEVSLSRYREFANIWIKEMRKEVSPFLSPIDRLRLELSEVWPSHCNLAEIGGHKLFAGLVREFKAGSYAEPHNDVLSWDLVSGMHSGITNQLAANVYLETSEQGGELRLWHEWPESKEAYNAIRIEGSYGVKAEQLNGGYLEITPEVGELILFNPTRIHSVEKIQQGSRLTWSCFIGLEDHKKALQVWS
ncbi:2OG-Fe(II) oxygenase [Vibrio mimicus]|uniref:2OG-Fe(II) oxygenase n=1 Tax=Vibrio mimicus TaxID=674 RepID=UPI0011D5BF7B|nr:2OG-Fe(II) oxygenase [Vibrio mimicus]TXY02826.1 2OG-Fe(II) oxygenase [Vibrio mimicus]